MVGTLDGKVALVTGSGRGIGRAIAQQLASEGARLVLNDLDVEPASEIAGAIRDGGGEAATCIGSVTEPEFADRFIGTAVDAFGGIDIIVNNAGFTWDSVIQKMSDEQWSAILDVHLTAPHRILRAAQPVISAAAKRERQVGATTCRKVVNISSIAGIIGGAGQTNYSAAKAGVIGMTRALAKEWGRYNVTVNAVAFGIIKTRLTNPADVGESIDIEGREIAVGMNPDVLGAAEQMIPLGRAGTAEEAAGAVYLMCSPESSYITGHTLVCDGGF